MKLSLHTVGAEIYKMAGYPEKNKPFLVVTNDGYWFKAHTTGDNNKQISAAGDEFIMGCWLKKKIYYLLTPDRSIKQDFGTILNSAKNLPVGNDIKIIVMNGKSDIDSDKYLTGCNFIVGGNILGRRVTFPQLQTIYYTRTSKSRRQIRCGSTAEYSDMTAIQV